MADYNELLKTIKQASTEAVEAGKPANVCFGKVLSASPLLILVDQKMALTAAFLVLSRNVTDYQTTVTVSWNTTAADGHRHSISGTKTMTVNNALKAGDKVILMRMQGGQKYVVIDRIGGG